MVRLQGLSEAHEPGIYRLIVSKKILKKNLNY